MGEIRGERVAVLLINTGYVRMDGIRTINVSLRINRKHKILRC
jgi:hypothetical protein